MTLQLDFPPQPSHELFEGLRPTGVGQDGDLVLLTFCYIDHCNLVSLSTLLTVKVLQLSHQLLIFINEMYVWSFLPGRKSQLLEEDASMLEGLMCVLVMDLWGKSRPS